MNLICLAACCEDCLLQPHPARPGGGGQQANFFEFLPVFTHRRVVLVGGAGGVSPSIASRKNQFQASPGLCWSCACAAKGVGSLSTARPSALTREIAPRPRSLPPTRPALPQPVHPSTPAVAVAGVTRTALLRPSRMTNGFPLSCCIRRVRRRNSLGVNPVISRNRRLKLARLL
jgi:hypothetical protein